MKIIQNSLLLLLLLAFALAFPMESSETEEKDELIAAKKVSLEIEMCGNGSPGYNDNEIDKDLTGTEDDTTEKAKHSKTIENNCYYGLVPLDGIIKLLDEQGISRHSLLTSLVKMGSPSQVLGDVFFHFTSEQAYKISDEEFYKTPIQSSDDKQTAIDIGDLIKTGGFQKIFDYLPMNINMNMTMKRKSFQKVLIKSQQSKGKKSSLTR